jgi:hypothetical protein
MESSHEGVTFALRSHQIRKYLMNDPEQQAQEIVPEHGRGRKFLTARWIVVLGLALCLLAIAVVRMALDHQVKTRLAELKKEKLPVSSGDLNGWLPPVVARENAALLVVQAGAAMARYKQGGRQPKWPEKAESLVLSPEKRKLFEESVAKNTEALQLVHEAVQLPGSRYPIDWSLGPGTLLPHLAQVKELSKLLWVEATLMSVDGNPDQAAHDVIDQFRLAHTLYGEPCMVSQLVRLHCLRLGTVTLEEILNRCSLKEDQLRAISEAMTQAEGDNEHALKVSLLGERAMGVYTFDLPAKTLMSYGDFGDSFQIVYPVVQASGFHEADFLFYLRYMQRWAELIDQPLPEALARAPEIEASFRAEVEHRPFFVISRLLVPSLTKALENVAATQARIKAAQAAIGIERFRGQKQGRAPETLGQLCPELMVCIPLDLITRSPLEYKPLSNGFELSYTATAADLERGLLVQPRTQTPQKEKGIFKVERPK